MVMLLCGTQLSLIKYELIKAMDNFLELNFFRADKTTVSSTFLIRLMFPGYRCESDIVICAWRVTWNYAYSPFNENNNILKSYSLPGTDFSWVARNPSAPLLLSTLTTTRLPWADNSSPPLSSCPRPTVNQTRTDNLVSCVSGTQTLRYKQSSLIPVPVD